MRRGIGALALVVGLGLATPLWAQLQAFSATHPNLVFQPVDTSKAIGAPVQFRAQRTSFVDLFRKIPLPTFPPVFGQSNLPPPSAFPTYPDFKAVPFVPANDLPRFIPPGFPRQ